MQEKRAAGEESEETIRAEWRNMPPQARYNVTARLRAKERRHAAARQRVADGVAGVGTLNFFAKGGQRSRSVPDWWMEKRRKEEDSGVELSDQTLADEWKALGRVRRKAVLLCQRLRVATMKRAVARIADGTDDKYTKTYVQQGGKTVHETPEAAAEKARLCILRRNQQIAMSRYQTRRALVQGCSIPGCVLNSCSLLSLIDDDHRDGVEKIASTSQIPLHLLEEEMKKTDPKCKWHHFLHTRKMLRFKTAEETTGDQKLLMTLKNTGGCSHPCHSRAPYKTLVPNAEADPLVTGFLHVSHVNPLDKKGKTYKLWLWQLEAGLAAVHCHFCHSMWTVCEWQAVEDTKPEEERSPRVAAEFQELLRLPDGLGEAFLAHFREKTSEVDWNAVRASRSANRSTAAKRRSTPHADEPLSKRQCSVDSEDDDADAEGEDNESETSLE
jgi:hypothetical protein